MKSLNSLRIAILLCVPLTSLAANGVQWDQWYIFSRGGQPAGYYQEIFEIKTGSNEMTIQQNFFETRGMGVENTYIHSVSNNDDKASPVSFYVKKRSRASIDIYEGIANNQEVGVRVHLGTENKPPKVDIIKSPGTTVLGALVPAYLAKQWSRGQLKKEIQFDALLEEGNEGKFEPAKVRAKGSNSVITVNQDKCREYQLSFNNIPATWWVSDAGKLCQLKIPSLNTELVMATQERAKNFLRGP